MSSGKDAKDIVMHFLKRTDQRATPAIIAKMINQAKSLLRSNYTKEEVISAIDYIIDVKKVDMYSLGYVNLAINNVLDEIKQIKVKEEVEKQTKQSNIPTNFIKEVSGEDESSERNRNKLSKFGTKSRFGKKYNFDMFEE